jgi:hypothetical protein
VLRGHAEVMHKSADNRTKARQSTAHHASKAQSLSSNNCPLGQARLRAKARLISFAVRFAPRKAVGWPEALSESNDTPNGFDIDQLRADTGAASSTLGG